MTRVTILRVEALRELDNVVKYIDKSSTIHVTKKDILSQKSYLKLPVNTRRQINQFLTKNMPKLKVGIDHLTKLLSKNEEKQIIVLTYNCPPVVAGYISQRLPFSFDHLCVTNQVDSFLKEIKEDSGTPLEVFDLREETDMHSIVNTLTGLLKGDKKEDVANSSESSELPTPDLSGESTPEQTEGDTINEVEVSEEPVIEESETEPEVEGETASNKEDQPSEEDSGGTGDSGVTEEGTTGNTSSKRKTATRKTRKKSSRSKRKSGSSSTTSTTTEGSETVSEED